MMENTVWWQNWQPFCSGPCTERHNVVLSLSNVGYLHLNMCVKFVRCSQDLFIITMRNCVLYWFILICISFKRAAHGALDNT